MPWSAVRADRDAARAERDRARTERDDARRALAAARRQRDAGAQALTQVRAELADTQSALDSARATLERTRTDVLAAHAAQVKRWEETTTEVQSELRKIRATGRTTDERVRALSTDLINDIQALDQLLDRFEPDARLPIVGGWAMSPTGLLALTEIVRTTEPETVVECGSGTSTLWLGYALQRLGRGRVIALDHSEEYAERTRSMVAAHGLTDFVEVRTASLAPRTTPRGEFPWYSFGPDDVEGSIDLLIVDGPPKSTGHLARYPALPVFRDQLAPGVTIVADDTHRPDEQEMLEIWTTDEPNLRRVEIAGPGIEILRFEGSA